MPYLVNMCPKDFEQAKKDGLTLLVPVGTVEYHGSQLPLGTDLFVTEGLCREIEKRVPVVVAPSFTFSPNGYAVSGPDKGTVDISVDTFMKYCGEILRNYREMGFKKIVVIVHHQADNIIKMLQAEIIKMNMYETYKETGNGWWTDNKASKYNCSISVLPAKLGTDVFPGHGGIGETEAVLALYPELVKMENIDDIDKEPFWNKTAFKAKKEHADEQLEKILKIWIEKLS